MKNLFLVGGTMGSGKTTVSQILKSNLPGAVFLDGDWCWDMDPFVVTDETMDMVRDNIVYLLNNFIRCTAYENIIFCWVMHQQEIIDDIVSRIDADDVNILPISLILTEESLKERLRKDIDQGKRLPDIIQRSSQRLPLYDSLKTIKIDVSKISPTETAEKIANLL